MVSANDIARIQWAKQQVEAIPRLATPRNITSFAAWSMAEGGWWDNDAAFNPTNTTEPFNGSHPINSVGVQAYKCEQDGLIAIAKTLNNGYYKTILAGLSASVTPTALAALVGASPWGTNGKLMLECVPRASAAYAAVYPPVKAAIAITKAVAAHPVVAVKTLVNKISQTTLKKT